LGATTSTNGSANEIETSSAVRDTAGRSKNRTIAGAIKQLFRAAAKAITGASEDEPQPARRRKKEGESESGMMRLARKFSRRFVMAKQPRTRHTAQAHKQGENFDTARAAITRRDVLVDAALEAPNPYLDTMNPFSPDTCLTDIDGDFSPPQDHCSPHL
jgi:hypothetical protein